MTGSGEELAGQTHSVNHGADELEVSPTLLSDVEVLQAIANGDKNALGILYNRFVARLLGAARRGSARHSHSCRPENPAQRC